MYDGASKDDPLIDVLTGFTLPSEILSSGPQIHLVFETDDIVNEKGFSLTYAQESTSGGKQQNVASVFTKYII